jgi:hypothetical protein
MMPNVPKPGHVGLRIPHEALGQTPSPGAGRPCLHRATQAEVSIWLVSLMQYDIGYFDLEALKVLGLDGVRAGMRTRRVGPKPLSRRGI